MPWFSYDNGKVVVGKSEIDLSDIFTIDVSYAPFTEYGYPLTPSNVIDSTATVIDPEILTLPAPDSEFEKFDAIFLEVIAEVKAEQGSK